MVGQATHRLSETRSGKTGLTRLELAGRDAGIGDACATEVADALGANKTLEDCNRVAAQVKLAAYVLMPVRALMVAAPPRINMAVTIRHAITRSQICVLKTCPLSAFERLIVF